MFRSSTVKWGKHPRLQVKVLQDGFCCRDEADERSSKRQRTNTTDVAQPGDGPVSTARSSASQLYNMHGCYACEYAKYCSDFTHEHLKLDLVCVT